MTMSRVSAARVIWREGEGLGSASLMLEPPCSGKGKGGARDYDDNDRGPSRLFLAGRMSKGGLEPAVCCILDGRLERVRRRKSWVGVIAEWRGFDLVWRGEVGLEGRERVLSCKVCCKV